MNEMFVLCGVAIVFIFVVAGLTKLKDASSTANALREFGVSVALSRRIAPILPITELGIAALVLLPQVAWVGAALATMLLAFFTVFVSIALVRGKRPSCNCFGQHRSTPISWYTVLRNALFTVFAGFLLWAGQGRLDDGLLAETANVIGDLEPISVASFAVTAIVVLQFWMLMNVVRQQGRMLLRIDNLEYQLNANGISAFSQFVPTKKLVTVGEVAPHFTATSLAGLNVTSKELLLEGKALALIFVSADCSPCKELLTELLLWRTPNNHKHKLVIIASGSKEANISKLGALIETDALLQTDLQVSELFGVVATPSAILIGRDGLIASQIAVGHDAIMALMRGVPARTLDDTPVPAVAHA